MQGQWLLVLDHYQLIPLSHIFSQLRGDICWKVDLVIWVAGEYIVPPYVNPWEKTIRPGGTDYHPNTSEIDRVSTYTGLDDYDILFATRHGRGALDQVPTMSEHMIMTSSVGITPITLGTGLMVNPLDRAELTSNFELPSQMEGASMTEHRVVSPSSRIIGEGVAIFTDMTETILNVLDQQMAMSSDIQKSKDVSMCDNQTKDTQGSVQVIFDRYPDLFLPVVENHRISDRFCGHSDSFSPDNNPMILVKLESLSYHYGTSIYAVDRVNSTMYGKFSVGYKIIPEKTTVIPQYQQTPAEDEYKPIYVNTLPGPTDIDTPIAKSTPVTQTSQVPVLPNVSPLERDIFEPISSEQARSTYLEHQIQGMNSVRLPLNIPLLDNELCTSTNLTNRIQAFCQEQKEKRKCKWESIRVALEKMKKSKGKYQKQQAKEERDAAYAQMVQNVEKTRAVVRNTGSRATTISAEECQLALMEKDFLAIQKKMDKIDQRLDDLYKNWHAEYRDAATLEECDEINKFYKPYLEKYESKYKILYHYYNNPVYYLCRNLLLVLLLVWQCWMMCPP